MRATRTTARSDAFCRTASEQLPVVGRGGRGHHFLQQLIRQLFVGHDRDLAVRDLLFFRQARLPQHAIRFELERGLKRGNGHAFVREDLVDPSDRLAIEQDVVLRDDHDHRFVELRLGRRLGQLHLFLARQHLDDLGRIDEQEEDEHGQHVDHRHEIDTRFALVPLVMPLHPGGATHVPHRSSL